MSFLILPQAASFPPEPGQWVRHASGDLLLCCPVCHVLIGVHPSVHTVGPDGMVCPSFVCRGRCNGGFHRFIRLAGYSASAP